MLVNHPRQTVDYPRPDCPPPPQDFGTNFLANTTYPITVTLIPRDARYRAHGSQSLGTVITLSQTSNSGNCRFGNLTLHERLNVQFKD